jgi:nicotinamide mononucleotide (NMN) deamidase PncC
MTDNPVQKLHESPLKLNIVHTGAGGILLKRLLCRAGASNTVLESTCTYATESTTRYLGGHEPEKFVGGMTARDMALIAFAKGLGLTEETHNLRGVAITASLGYPEQREGRDNHAYVAIAGDGFVDEYYIDLTRISDDDRIDQDHYLAECVIDILNYELEQDYLIRSTRTLDRIYSGSFNPLHEGHKHIFKHTSNCCYELCINNADKGTIDIQSISDRVVQFSSDPVVLCTVGKFSDKLIHYAQVLGKAPTFVVGGDTADRIFGRDSGCNAEFLVYGKVSDKTTLSHKCYVSNLKVPSVRSSDLREIFDTPIVKVDDLGNVRSSI